MLDDVSGFETPSYPPYNIERLDEHDYRNTMAVAGFSQDDLIINVNGNTLSIAGKKSSEANGKEGQFLHQGIASRSFERRFQLADFMEVRGADLENGLLHVTLKREVPEAMKPRNIAINTGKPSMAKPKVIENNAA